MKKYFTDLVKWSGLSGVFLDKRLRFNSMAPGAGRRARGAGATVSVVLRPALRATRPANRPAQSPISVQKHGGNGVAGNIDNPLYEVCFIFIAVSFLALGMPEKAMASTVLEGVILENRPGGPPLPGVMVSSPGAKKSFRTTNSGRFRLEFPQKKAGDMALLTCAREGMEVVNDMALEARLGSKPAETPVRLFMCKQGERDVHAANYYRIEIRRVIDGNFWAEVERIKGAHQKDIDRKNAEIARLFQEKEKALVLSDEWAKKFAEVRRNTASELYKEAYRLFQAGDIDRAIAVLDDAKLEEARRIAKAALEKSVETHMLKARLLIMKLRFDEAEKYFRIAVDDAPGNLENIFEFAVYLQKQNKHPAALELYKDALFVAEKSGNDEAVATTLNNFGVLQNDLNDYPAAEKAYKRTLEIREKLAEENPNTYLPYVAMTQNNLGTFYSDLNDYPAAEKAFKRALEIYEKLVEENPDAYLPDVAISQNNIGLFFLLRKENRKAPMCASIK